MNIGRGGFEPPRTGCKPAALAVVYYAVNGEIAPSGIRLDLDKRSFIDRPLGTDTNPNANGAGERVAAAIATRGAAEEIGMDVIDHRAAAIEATVILVERLAEFYATPEEVAQYLRAPQPLLNGNTAMNLLAQGRGDEVHRLLDQLDAGVYL